MVKKLRNIFFLLLYAFPIPVSGQSLVIDSTQIQQYRIKETDAKTTSEEKQDNSFVGVVTKLGNGLLNKLKRRFNLEGIADKIENTKEKVKEKLGSEKEEKNSEPLPHPPDGQQ